MPRFRRRRYGRRRRGAKPWYKRRYSAIQLASKAYRAARYLKTMVNAEKKKYDASTTLSVANAGASYAHLNAIAQGDGNGSRDGNSILMHSLSARFTVKQHASATMSQVRIILLQDSQQVGDTTPGWSTIFNDTDVNAFLHAQTGVGRFTILASRIVSLQSNGKQVQNLSLNLRLNKHARFNGTAATDIQKNGIYLFAISDEATNTPTVEYHTRLNFYDN